MEAFRIFKFRRNAAAGAEITCEVDGARISASDDEDSLFDLAFESLGNRDAELMESPRDVFLSKSDFSTPDKPLSPVIILRSVPKLRVFTLGFRKSPRSEKIQAAEPPVLPRDNSLRSRMLVENRDYDAAASDVVSPSGKSVPKYLKLIKPFYAKASSKAKSTDSVTPSSSPAADLSPRKLCEVSRVGSFRIMTRSLGKSRSVDSAAPPSFRRRDESLLEQQNDGIQGAILHCKKSYSDEKLTINSCEEQKRCSI